METLLQDVRYGLRMLQRVEPMLREGMLAATVGIGLGLAGALILARLMSTLLFGVKSDDPLTFSAVVVLIAAIAALASYVPAQRASWVDPMAALRYQ
jgi:ABC-type antimicrobial peptide transport system permease subunit